MYIIFFVYNYILYIKIRPNLKLVRPYLSKYMSIYNTLAYYFNLICHPFNNIKIHSIFILLYYILNHSHQFSFEDF